jgi:hypothetical protein
MSLYVFLPLFGVGAKKNPAPRRECGAGKKQTYYEKTLQSYSASKSFQNN